MKHDEKHDYYWKDFLRRHPLLKQSLVYLNHFITYIMYLTYPLFLAERAFQGKWEWKYLFIPALGFALVSLVRQAINAPRPYEVYSFQPLIAKGSKGNSMPSRHVFSASLISMCLLDCHLVLGLLGLLLSAILAVCRVLVGVHFLKDVVVGMLLGMVVGGICFLI